MVGPFFGPILKMISHSRPDIGHTSAVVSFISVIESSGFFGLYSLEI
jgi:hypothetical protein